MTQIVKKFYLSRLLASASDDKDIILWDPFCYEKKLVVHTGHHGNIFSVKVNQCCLLHNLLNYNV